MVGEDGTGAFGEGTTRMIRATAARRGSIEQNEHQVNEL